MNNIIIYNHDIVRYPPILSLIESLYENGEHVEIIGFCSSEIQLQGFKKRGINYFETFNNKTQDSKLKKLFNLIKYKKTVYTLIKKRYNEDSVIWLYGNQNAWLLYKLVYKFKCVLYLFEIPSFKVNFRYKLLSPRLNYKWMMQKAYKVVCSEYNRAKITQAYFGLKETPAIIPNKPNYSFEVSDNDKVKEVKKIIPIGKKIILYQGIFNQPERRLNELCESIEHLSDDFIICIMGEESSEKKNLQEKYSSERVIFLPFLPAPLHLQITRIAYIGFLSYFSEVMNIENALNTLYCAPNKTFEYSMFGIPMISNDLPSLKLSFEEFKSGIVSKNFTPRGIAESVLTIDENYTSFQNGSREFFESINISHLYMDIIR
jgi:hypothetical protein